MNDVETNDPAKSLSELMEPGSTLMVGTLTAGGVLEFRPLTVARVAGDRIDILLDTREEWTRSITDDDEVYVTLSDTRSNTWVALRGTLSITTDAALVDRLWSPFADAFFDKGRQTPGISVLTIDAESGRYWTSPSGRIGSLVAMVKAKLGGAEQSGEKGDLRL